MNCFFSGTDSDELHDNAPNHNYYLSLIVNYQDHNSWVAEVAICAEQKIEGTVRRSTNYLNKDGFEERGTVEETLNETVEVLYRIPCEISVDEEENSTYGRVKSLLEAKKKAVTTSYRPWERWIGTSVQGGTTHSRVGNSTSKDFNKELSEALQTKMPFEGEMSFDEEFNTELRPDNMYTPAKVKPFLMEILAGPKAAKNRTLDQIIAQLNQLTNEEASMLADSVSTNLEKSASEYFKLDDVYAMDTHCISVVIQDILNPYDKLDVVAELKLTLDIDFVLPGNLIDEEEEFRLTSLLLTETEEL